MKPLILIAGTMDVHRRYYELVQKSGMNAQMLSYRAGEAFPYSSLQNLSFDLLLLPGGGDFDPAFYGETAAGAKPSDGMLDLMQFQLLQLALVRKKPVIGICKGMQLIHVFSVADFCRICPKITCIIILTQWGTPFIPSSFCRSLPYRQTKNMPCISHHRKKHLLPNGKSKCFLHFLPDFLL